MGKRVLVINGHPDPAPERFCSALAEAYSTAAANAGHEVRTLSVGNIDFPLIRSRAEFEDGEPPAAIASAQEMLRWSEHIVIVHPLWLGSAPALLKGFFEQAFRYGFAMPQPGEGMPHGLLSGRSARLVVTMGMPGFIYATVFGAFGVRAMKRGMLGISGIRPVRLSYLGQVELKREQRLRWLDRIRALGRAAI